MGTSEDEVTDKHDESDSAQFGDDPHNLRNTPFREAACKTCGAYVVASREYVGNSYCLGCARVHAGVMHSSGAPTGDWYPVVDFRQHTHTTSGPALEVRSDGWHWGCLYCRETGTAINPDHATAMHKIHLGFACPAAPGLSILEVKHRLQRRQPHTDHYPDTTPQMHLQDNPDGTWKAAFTHAP